MSRAAWARAAVGGPTHDVVVVVAGHGAAVDAQHLRGVLGRRRSASGGRPEVVGVDEPPRARRGNLGGTLRSWTELTRSWPSLAQAVREGASALIVHDAGAATRSWPWADALEGRRGRLGLPGRLGGGTTLLGAVTALSSPLASSNPGAVVDVVWTSQLLLPDVDPLALPRPRHDLTKLCWRGLSAPSLTASRELGWFGLDGDEVVSFAPAGAFADAEALAAWAVPARAADLGAFRIGARWLDDLAAADLGVIDLDPGLTGPVVRGDATGPLAAALARHGPLRIGATPLAGTGRWLRLRRPVELLELGDALRTDPDLRRALDVPGALDGVTWRGVALPDDADVPTLRDAWLRDVRAGGRLVGVVGVGVVGEVEASRAVLVDVRGPCRATDAVLVGCDGPTTAAGEVVAGRPAMRAPLDGAPVR